MAETALPVQTSDSIHGGKVEDMTFTAADAANNMEFVNNGRTRVLINNASGGPLAVIFTSVNCSHGRTGDKTVTTGAADISEAGPFEVGLFNQSDGKVIITIATDTSLSLAAISDA